MSPQSSSTSTEVTQLLADLIAPVSVGDFLERHFLREPLHIRGDSSRIARFPRIAALEPVLREASCVRAVFNDLRQARIHGGDAADMLGAGATICVTGAERGCDWLRALAASAKQEIAFSGDVTVRAYWSPRGSGFGVHFDPRIVTTIQVEGTKRWWFTTKPAEELPLEAVSAPLTDEQRAGLESMATTSVVLEPGDILCLPPGTWHWAQGETECLAYNLAFDYVGGSIGDLLAEALRVELSCDPRMRVPLYGDLRKPEVMLEHLREACAKASAALDKARGRPDLLLRLWRRSLRASDGR